MAFSALASEDAGLIEASEKFRERRERQRRSVPLS
jgi:hypothetical protein